MKLDPALLWLAAAVAALYFIDKGSEKRRVSPSAKGVCLPCERAAGRA